MIERLAEWYMRAFCFVVMALRGSLYRGRCAPSVPSNYRADYRFCRELIRRGAA